MLHEQPPHPNNRLTEVGAGHRRSLPKKLATFTLLVVLLLPSLACWDGNENWVFDPVWVIFRMLASCTEDPSQCNKAVPVASPGNDLYLGASAHLTGEGGTNWRSDVELLNVGDGTARVSIDVLEHGVDNSLPLSQDFELNAGQALRLGDILANEFAFNGKAALRIRTTSGEVIATSRTYNLLGDDNSLELPAGSTFGQYIPARTSGDAVDFGAEGRMIGLSNSLGDGTGFRTNLGLVNTSAITIEVVVELFRGTSERLGQVTRTLAPYEYLQISRIFERVTNTDVADGFAVATTQTDGGSFLAQASIVDNLTGDPVFVPAVLVSAAAKTARPAIYIPAAAHVAGAGGSNWRTDLTVHNWGAASAEFTVELLRHGQANPQPASETFMVRSKRSLRLEDLLQSVFSFDGSAALRITATDGDIIVTSRTYNLILGDKGLPDGATFGQYIPAVGSQSAVHQGERGLLIQLAEDSADDRGFRSNIALVNLTDGPIAVDIDLFDNAAQLIGTTGVSLGRAEYRQINRVFRRVTSETVDDGYAVLRTSTDGGVFLALASVVDNLTSDPVGMTAAQVIPDAQDRVVESIQDAMDLLGGVGSADGSDVEGLVGTLVQTGIPPLLDLVADGFSSDVASNTAGQLSLDFGDGTDVNGYLVTGSIDLDASGLSISEDGINGTISESFSGVSVDGDAALFEAVDLSLDLDISSDGTVTGEAGVSAGQPRKSGGASLAGQLGFDTAICANYPVSGSLTLVLDDVTITIEFGPSCDGSFNQVAKPRWDFTYSARNPSSAHAQEYIVDTANAELYLEGPVWLWKPVLGAETFEETTPGVVTYRFDFQEPTAEAELFVNMPTFHWSYSQGHNFLFASNDGSNWVQLLDVTPPDFGGANAGTFNGLLPSSVLGSNQIWLRADLYSYGPNAAGGGAWTNTAQHNRYDVNGDNVTFKINVAYEGSR